MVFLQLRFFCHIVNFWLLHFIIFLHLNLLRKQTEGERTALTQVAACQNSVVIGDKFKRVKHTYFDEMHAA